MVLVPSLKPPPVHFSLANPYNFFLHLFFCLHTFSSAYLPLPFRLFSALFLSHDFIIVWRKHVVHFFLYLSVIFCSVSLFLCYSPFLSLSIFIHFLSLFLKYFLLACFPLSLFHFSTFPCILSPFYISPILTVFLNFSSSNPFVCSFTARFIFQPLFVFMSLFIFLPSYVSSKFSFSNFPFFFGFTAHLIFYPLFVSVSLSILLHFLLSFPNFLLFSSITTRFLLLYYHFIYIFLFYVFLII